MLLRTANYTLEGRLQAVVTILGFAVLSLFFPLVGLLSSGALGLVTLRKGVLEGLQVAAIASCIVAGLGLLFSGALTAVVTYAGLMWLPPWVAASVLRVWRNFGAAVETAGLLGLGAVASVYAWFPDPSAMWTERFRQIVEPLAASGTAPNIQQIEKLGELFSPYLTGMIAAGSVLSLIVSLSLARWLQARLFNPGGFGAEFADMRFRSVTHYLAVGFGAAALSLDGRMAELFASGFLVLSVLFVILGLAILQRVLARRPNARFWLAGIYVLALLVPQLLLPVAVLGITDLWMNWRSRWSPE